VPATTALDPRDTSLLIESGEHVVSHFGDVIKRAATENTGVGRMDDTFALFYNPFPAGNGNR